MTKSYCSWTIFSWKFAPTPKIQNIFTTRVNTIIISHHHIISSYHIIISHHHIISSVKNFEKWLSLTVHEPFFLEICPEIQNSKYFSYMGQHYHHINIIISYRHIISSISNHDIISSVKNFEKWRSLTAHEPFFLANLPTKPEIQNIFSYMPVHTITLNTVTIVIKSYPYRSYYFFKSYHQ